MTEKCCDTCAHKGMESQDEDGNRTVDCLANPLQMFAPYAEECKHWEKALEESRD